MPLAVNHPTAAAWGGKVYVHGGFANESGLTDATARLFEYDPKADRWRELAPSATARAAHALVAIDGRLYAAGGANSASDQITSLEVYDIETGTWSAGRLRWPSAETTSRAPSLDGRFYVMGGRPPFNLAVVERYDPATNTWTTLAPLDTPRSGFAAAAVGGPDRRLRRRGRRRSSRRSRSTTRRRTRGRRYPTCEHRATASAECRRAGASTRSRAGPQPGFAFSRVESGRRSIGAALPRPACEVGDSYSTTTVPVIVSGCSVQR